MDYTYSITPDDVRFLDRTIRDHANTRVVNGKLIVLGPTFYWDLGTPSVGLWSADLTSATGKLEFAYAELDGFGYDDTAGLEYDIFADSYPSPGTGPHERDVYSYREASRFQVLKPRFARAPSALDDTIFGVVELSILKNHARPPQAISLERRVPPGLWP